MWFAKIRVGREGGNLAPEAKQGRIYGYGYANPMRQGFPLHPTATSKAPSRARVFAIAIYSAITVPVGRRSGRSSVSAAAYRAGVDLFERAIGKLHEYSHRGGVVKSASRIFFPDGEPVDRAELWNAAEAAERRVDSRTAREWKLAIPHELPPLARSELVYAFARHLVDRYGVAVDVAIHLPSWRGDDRNHHAHVLSTTRRVGRMEGGTLVFGNKTSIELADKDRKKAGIPGRAADEIKETRLMWSTLANEALARHGHDGRIDHRSYVDQAKAADMPEELAFLPMIHLGPGATYLERSGTRTLPGNINREIQRTNLAIEQSRKHWKQQRNVRPSAEITPPFKASAGEEIASTPAPFSILPPPAADTAARQDRLRAQLRDVLGLSTLRSAAEARDVIQKRRDELRTIQSQRINLNEAIATANRRTHMAMKEMKAFGQRWDELQARGRKLQAQASQNAAATQWRLAHPMRAWLHDMGFLTLPVAAIVGSQDELRRAWEQARKEDEQLRLQLEAAQHELREASLLREQLRTKIKQEANSEVLELSARLDQAESLAADLQRIEEAEQQERKLEALPIARKPDMDRDDEPHRRLTP